MAVIREKAKLVPHVTWSRQELKLVAQECAKLYRSDPPKKFTTKHFLKAQLVLPENRRKKQFSAFLIPQLRKMIADVPLPPDPEEDTAAVHNGGYDRMIEAAFNGEAMPATDHAALAVDEAIRTQPAVIRLPLRETVQNGDACEQIVAILVDINLKSLALKGFTGRQLEEAVSNHVDHGRLRNLTIQASNSLTYFEQLLGVAAR